MPTRRVPLPTTKALFRRVARIRCTVSRTVVSAVTMQKSVRSSCEIGSARSWDSMVEVGMFKAPKLGNTMGGYSLREKSGSVSHWAANPPLHQLPYLKVNLHHDAPT